MGRGARQVLLTLLNEGKLDGAIGLGGNQGTAIAAMALRSLPLGFPKFLFFTTPITPMSKFPARRWRKSVR